MLVVNLGDLKFKLEHTTGRSYSWEEIANGAGLHRNTLYKIVAGDSRANLKTIEQVIRYFREQGIEIEVDELFTLKEAPAEAA